MSTNNNNKNNNNDNNIMISNACNYNSKNESRLSLIVILKQIFKI